MRAPDQVGCTHDSPLRGETFSGPPCVHPTWSGARTLRLLCPIRPSLTFDLQAFYGKFRRTHTHHVLMKEPLWIPKDLQEWNDLPSTKLQALVTILQWHLEQDGRAMLRTHGVVEEADQHAAPEASDTEEDLECNVLEPCPDWENPTPRHPNSCPDRIVVYVAFPSNNALITKVNVSMHACYILTDTVFRFWISTILNTWKSTGPSRATPVSPKSTPSSIPRVMVPASACSLASECRA